MTEHRDFAMGDEINEGVKLKPRVMAGNNLARRPRPSSLNFFPFLFFLLFFMLVLFLMSRADWRWDGVEEREGKKEDGKPHTGLVNHL